MHFDLAQPDVLTPPAVPFPALLVMAELQLESAWRLAANPGLQYSWWEAERVAGVVCSLLTSVLTDDELSVYQLAQDVAIYRACGGS